MTKPITAVKTMKFEGKEYVTINDFAKLSGRTGSMIHQLVKTGRDGRKLKSVTYGCRRYVLLSELEEFPFTKYHDEIIALKKRNKELEEKLNSLQPSPQANVIAQDVIEDDKPFDGTY